MCLRRRSREEDQSTLCRGLAAAASEASLLPSSACSSASSVRLCDDVFSYTNSSLGTGSTADDVASALYATPPVTDNEDSSAGGATDLGDVIKKRLARKVGRKSASSPYPINWVLQLSTCL